MDASLDDLFKNLNGEPSPFDVGVTNSTATTTGMIPKAPAAPPYQLTQGPGMTDSLLASLNNPGNPANPAIPPVPQGQNGGGTPPPVAKPVQSPPPNGQVQNSPAGDLSAILGSANNIANSVYGQYGPDKRNELIQYMLAKQNSMPNAIGSALAGIGDAIARGPGGQNTHFAEDLQKSGRDTLNAAVGNFDEMQKQKKQATETGLSLEQMDPTSPISKSAQTAAKPMLAAAGLSDAQIANLPASAIDNALKSATSFADAKAKLAQVAAMKEYNLGLREDQQQDKLEKEERDRLDKVTSARSGGLGSQDAKVNQAIHLMGLMDQYKDGKGNYNIPPAQYEELAIGLANLVSGGSAPTQSMIDGIKQRTAQGDLNGALTWATGHNFNGSTQDIFKNLRDSIERQGLFAEQQRDKYLKDFADTAPSRLQKSRLDHLTQTARGSSVKEYLKNEGSQMGPGAEPPVQKMIGGKTYVKQNGQWYAL